jgi:hypothetical protein
MWPGLAMARRAGVRGDGSELLSAIRRHRRALTRKRDRFGALEPRAQMLSALIRRNASHLCAPAMQGSLCIPSADDAVGRGKYATDGWAPALFTVAQKSPDSNTELVVDDPTREDVSFTFRSGG